MTDFQEGNPPAIQQLQIKFTLCGYGKMNSGYAGMTQIASGLSSCPSEWNCNPNHHQIIGSLL